MSGKNSAKKNKISSIITTIIYIIVIALLICTLIINANRKENQISSFFGFSFAVVQSGSMIDGGFNIGDMVIIKQVNPDAIKKGDIIVFYQYYSDAYDVQNNNKINHNQVISYQDFIANNKQTNGNLVKISTELNDGDIIEPVGADKSTLNLTTKEQALENFNPRLIFHRVIDIYVDENGIRYYKTQGDSNNQADNAVREDMVCAKYLGEAKFMQTILNFIATPLGLMLIIIIPILVTVILEVFVFGKELKANVIVEKLLNRKLKLKDVDTAKYRIADFLSAPEKVFYYDIAEENEKENVAIVIWDESVEEKLKLYEKSRNKFYLAFNDEFTKSDQKKLNELKIRADIIKKQPDIDDKALNKLVKEKLNLQKEKQNDTGNSN